MRSLPLAAVFLISGCITLTSPAWDGNPASCDAVLHGACVRFEGNVDRDTARLDALMAGSLAYWGAAEGTLRGHLIRIRDTLPQECGGDGHQGCYVPDELLIDIQDVSARCPFLLLPHEIGHAVIGDSQHADARWQSIPSVPWTCR